MKFQFHIIVVHNLSSTHDQVIEDISGAYFKEEDFDCSELELQVQLNNYRPLAVLCVVSCDI